MKYKIVLALMIVMISSTALAKFKAEDLIKYRQSGMMFMRWNMAKIKQQVVKYPQSHNKEQVIAAAKTIAAISNSGLGALFTPETETGEGWKKTRLKSEYFEQPDEVKKRAKTFTKEANKLVIAANSGNIDVIEDQFETLFKACKACHKKFRTKNKKLQATK